MQAVVALYCLHHFFLAIEILPVCISKKTQSPNVPSHTHFNSDPKGIGLRSTKDKCGIPPFPLFPRQANIISSGVTLVPTSDNTDEPEGEKDGETDRDQREAEIIEIGETVWCGKRQCWRRVEDPLKLRTNIFR